MPPKQTANKKAQKLVEDKKKSAKVQKHIQQLSNAAASGGSVEERKKAAEKQRKEDEKRASELAKKEAAALFKPVQIQKVAFGVDPKSVVCVFYKQGTCDKGRKCKFSHDMSVERKTEKRSLYDNGGEGSSSANDNNNNAEDSKKNDTMDTWDEEKLRDVIMSKHGNPKTTTDIVCKYFVEAVENGKYGWFWTCPNGGETCKYKHTLPPGFQITTAKARAAEKALLDKSPLRTLTLEDFLETERHKLTGNLTPVTEESFMRWKEQRMSKKAAEEEARRKKEETGRELFEKGGWEDEGSDSDDDGAGKGKEKADIWDLAELRKQTEAAAEEAEAERLKDGGEI